MTDQADVRVQRKSPWNSLEIAKLFMGLGTRLALFGLGFMVSNQAKKEAEAKEQTAKRELREEKAGADVKRAKSEQEKRDLETRIRREASEFQRDLQDRALAREESLRREGFAREKALRDEAFGREQAVRRQALNLERTAKIVEKRIEFWDKLALKLAEVDRAIDDILLKRADMTKINVIFRESDDLFGLYRPYFPPKFVEDYREYKKSTLFFANLVGAPVNTLFGMAAGDGALAACNSYIRLRDSAAFEVASATGLAGDASDRHISDPSDYADCSKRSDEIRAVAMDMERASVAK